MTDSNTHRRASANDTHHNTRCIESKSQIAERPPTRRRRATIQAQNRASATATTRPGPADTAPPPTCGAHAVQGVTWLEWEPGQFGWAATALSVADQFATAAIPSTTVAGTAARTENSTICRAGNMASTTGSPSRISGCTAIPAPISQADLTDLPSASARMPYSRRATATASSGWPNRTETFHSAMAPAAASSARVRRCAPDRSAMASAAKSTRADRPIV